MLRDAPALSVGRSERIQVPGGHPPSAQPRQGHASGSSCLFLVTQGQAHLQENVAGGGAGAGNQVQSDGQSHAARQRREEVGPPAGGPQSALSPVSSRCGFPPPGFRRQRGALPLAGSTKPALRLHEGSVTGLDVGSPSQVLRVGPGHFSRVSDGDLTAGPPDRRPSYH